MADFQVHRNVTLRELSRMNIKTPDFQRPIDEERVQDIVASQRERLSKGFHVFFIGTIILAKASDDGCLSVLDGQHRYAAMTMHLVHDAPEDLVGITVLSPPRSITLKEMFCIVNRSVPVPDYIINNTVLAAGRIALARFGHLFSSAFGSFVSRSTMPRRPNIHLENLKEQISRSTHIIDAFTTSGEELMEYVMWVNDHLLRRCGEQFRTSIETKARKIAKHPLALTADPDYMWLSDERWLQAFREGIEPPATFSCGAPPPPPNVSKALRMALWNNTFGPRAGVGGCQCCGTEITQQNFQAGHRVARAKGGETALINLVPLCTTCNLSMGTADFETFRLSFLTV